MWMTLLIIAVMAVLGGLLAIWLSNRFNVIEELVEA